MNKKATNKNQEIDESIPDRDWDFEGKQNEILYQNYVDHYIEEIDRMGEDEAFVIDNSFNGVKANHHIMYKCIVNEKSGETLLTTSDGCIGYEFLVEFDKLDPAYGIYYGCRGYIKEGNQKEGIDRIKQFWEMIQNETSVVLNNTFVGKDFSRRFQKTNNVNNKTYWPFWIALGADEDIIEIAARATKIIRNMYKKYINGGCPTVEKRKMPVEIRYTEKAYLNVLDKIAKKFGETKAEEYDKFIERLVKKKIVILDDRYEKCWKFREFENVDVRSFMTMAFKKLGLMDKRIPWEYFTPIFLSIHDADFDDLRKQFSKGSSDDIAKQAIESLFPPES